MIDGRALVGRLMCIDRLCNLILDDVMEYRPISLNPPEWKDTPKTAALRLELQQVTHVHNPLRCTERYLNLAMINKQRLAKILVEPSSWEDARKYALAKQQAPAPALQQQNPQDAIKEKLRQEQIQKYIEQHGGIM
jgi:small nuclear ribonucleoprotein (snRNP)-like protein